MKNDYFRQLTLAARWMLPPEEAGEVLSEYREILDDHGEDESLRRDLGDPVEAMRLVSQPKQYRRWLTAFAAMAACLLLPALSPLPAIGWWLWRFFDQALTAFPVELIFLAAGLGVSLVWFRRRRGERSGPLPRGMGPLAALYLAALAAVWSLLWIALFQPQGAMDFFLAHAGFAGRVADNLLWTGFFLSLAGLWALVQARLTDRRWRAVYVLSLTVTVLVMAALSLLRSMSLDTPPAGYLPYYALLTALGLVGTGVSLC